MLGNLIRSWRHARIQDQSIHLHTKLTGAAKKSRSEFAMPRFTVGEKLLFGIVRAHLTYVSLSPLSSRLRSAA